MSDQNDEHVDDEHEDDEHANDEHEDNEDANDEDEGGDTQPAPHRGAIARTWRPLAAALLVLLLVGAGVACAIRADKARTTGAIANHAVIDKATTSQVIAQVSTALNQVLSYDYTKPQVAQQAAKKWLAGDAPKQYQILFTELQTKLAPGEKLTFVAKVVTAGVVSLRGNTAQLLVFVDQQSTRVSDKQSSVAAAQVQISAVRHAASWQITELQVL